MIERCLRRMVDEKLDSIATFHEAEINPGAHLAHRRPAGREPFIRGAIPWKPRQLLTPAYQLNAAVYAFRPDRAACGFAEHPVRQDGRGDRAR